MKKLRILSVILLIAIVTVAFASCAAYGGAEKTFTHGKVEITATNRFVKTDISEDSFMLMAPLSGTVINVSRIGQTGYDTFTDYLDDYLKVLTEDMSCEITGGSYQKIDGNYVIELEKTEDGTPVSLYEVFLTDGYGDTWIASFGCEAGSYAEYRPYFQEWAKTIKFVD